MMGVGGDHRVRVAPNVHAREFDGELVILDLERGEYFGLDEIGAFAWAALARGRSPDDVAREIVKRYEVDQGQALSDLVALVDEWVERGLVVVEEPR